MYIYEIYIDSMARKEQTPIEWERAIEKWYKIYEKNIFKLSIFIMERV